MKEILETTQLEFDKSAFLIDLVKHDKGKLYIEIVQTINDGNSSVNTIKINPTILTDLLKVLQSYQAKIPANNPIEVKHLTDTDQQKIQDRYFKGVSVKDLALQFDQTEELIEMILRNRGVSIVSNEIPKSKRWRKRTR
jgi:3-deoxy-D-arabino-heptulosonate 7-phosphate (DAHP) synthase